MMKKVVLFASFLFLLLPPSVHGYLAKVNGEEITVEDFSEYLRGVHLHRMMRGAEKGGALSREMIKRALQDLIDQYLMAQEASRLGLDESEDYLREFERVKGRLAKWRMWQEEYERIGEPSDEELWEFYRKRVEGVRVRQIFTRDRKRAEEAYRRIKEGEDFSQVARELSEGPFAQWGGRTGTVRRGEMDARWEQVVFSMTPGEISGIIEAGDGFYIVKLEGIRKAEKEKFEREREGIRRRFLKEKRREIRRRLLERLRREADIQVKEDLLRELSLRSPPDQVLARVNGEPVYVGEVLPVLKSKLFGYEARRRRWRIEYDEGKVREEALREVIDDHLLVQEALGRGYFERDPQLRHMLHRYEVGILADYFRRKLIAPQVRLKEGEVKEHYRKNIDKYLSPARFRLSVIRVASREEAEGLREELLAGADFSYLARERSLDRSGKRGGSLGWVSERELTQRVRDLIRKLKPGEISPVVQDGSRYAIFKLEEVKEGAPIPFEKVKEEVKRDLWRKKFSQLLSEYLGKLREMAKIVVDERALQKLEKEFRVQE